MIGISRFFRTFAPTSVKVASFTESESPASIILNTKREAFEPKT